MVAFFRIDLSSAHPHVLDERRKASDALAQGQIETIHVGEQAGHGYDTESPSLTSILDKGGVLR